VGTSQPIRVLERGQKSADTYRMTPDELYHLGKAAYDDKDYDAASQQLRALFDAKDWRLDDSVYRETARMLLFVSIEQNKPADVVRFFEILKEKYPELTIPFDEIVKVGDAYVTMKEYERGLLVFKATADSSFVKEAQVARALEEQGQFLASVDFLVRLLRSYPDTPVTESALFGLSQLVYENAGKVKEIADLREGKVTRRQMILRAIELLKDFLTHYPANPAADQASFSMANAFLELEDYAYAADLTRRFEKRYGDSTYLDGFQYTRAYCTYALTRYDEALADCTKVATADYALPGGTRGPSKNKWLAYYIMGQIYHSRNMPAKAIEFYTKVKTQFVDAAQAIDYFDHKTLRLPEVTTFKPGEQVILEVTYRNIKATDVKVYRVDLMKLYLLHKNLDRITSINLAGIHPLVDQTVPLGDGKDYIDKTHKLALKVQKEGAYLVVVRGDDLNRSGMVLVTPLELDVQEDTQSGRVRVNVRNAKTGAYAAKVHVKVIGTRNDAFQSGETDLRGIFVADGIVGKATVIARDADGRYAFFRGTETLGGLTKDEETRLRALGYLAVDKDMMLRNLTDANKYIQQENRKQLKRLYEAQPSVKAGVQVKQAE